MLGASSRLVSQSVSQAISTFIGVLRNCYVSSLVYSLVSRDPPSVRGVKYPDTTKSFTKDALAMSQISDPKVQTPRQNTASDRLI